MIRVIGSKTLMGLRHVEQFVALVGRVLSALFFQVFRLKFRYKETLEQTYQISVQSLPVILFALIFVSVLFIVEFSYHMKLVLKQDSLVPAFSTVFMLREFGPVVTCFLLTSRVGAAMAAEIGIMKVTEQLESLQLLGIEPAEYLLLPRWIACVFACVSLSLIAVGVGVVAGAWMASVRLNFPIGQYFNTMFTFARPSDFLHCAIKSAVFGTIIPFVAVYQGFHCKNGAEGIGNAATHAVVYGFLLIFIADFLLTYLLYAL